MVLPELAIWLPELAIWVGIHRAFVISIGSA